MLYLQKEEEMLYQILPKKNYQFSNETTLMLFKSLSTPHKRKSIFKQLLNSTFDYKFIIDCDKDGVIAFYFEVAGDDKGEGVLHTLQSWCGAEADIFIAISNFQEYDTVNTLYTVNQEKGQEKKRLANYTNGSIFLNIINSLQKYTRIMIDFKINKVSSEQRASQFTRTSDVELELLLRVYGHTKYSRNEVRNISHKISNLTAGDRHLKVDYKDSWKVFRSSGSELMNLFQIPTLYRCQDPLLLKRLQYLRPGQITLNEKEFAKGVKAGKLYHPMQKERDVYLSERILRSHMLITGTTGSGKTSAIEEQINDILLRKVKGEKNVPGFTFFDPAESSVLGVLDMVLKLKDDGYNIDPLLDKIIYVDFRDTDYIFPISLINKNVDSNELINFLNSLFVDANAIQVERLMNSAINSLLMDKEEHSIFDVERLFVDEKFRMKIADSLKGNMYAQRELEFLNSKFNSNMVSPILNRLDPFANSRNKKLMFGMTTKYDQTKNIRKWMDEGYIILFNVKGLNTFDIKTIVGYYALQCYRTALTRPDYSLMHMLITDESHKVQLDIFTKVTAELRKQGLSLVLMTQQMEQYNPDYLKKLIGNINTIISFRQNDDMAARNVKNFILSDIELNDFKTLPDLIGYVSTFDDYDKQKKSVLVKVKPPYRYTEGKLVNYLNEKAVSQNRDKNVKFAKEIMSRHLMTCKEAEEIVFKNHFDKMNEKEYEDELLVTGDSYLSVEEGENISWEK